jgi:hypothetical protein
MADKDLFNKDLFRRLVRAPIIIASAIVCVSSGASIARADDAAQILKTATDYMAAQQSITAKFDSDIEIVTPDLQKIQFASSGQLKLQRPDKLRIKRTGGYVDAEMIYDGKTLTLYGNNAKTYVQADDPGTVDHIIDVLQSQAGGATPGADLLLSKAYDELMADVIDAKHIGVGVVDGVECEHLAFRGIDTDWQIWIETGARPVPRKYVITSKTLAGAPQYTLRIKDWNTDAIADADAFVFKPPADTTKVSLVPENMMQFDELPPGTAPGDKTGTVTTGTVAGEKK